METGPKFVEVEETLDGHKKMKEVQHEVKIKPPPKEKKKVSASRKKKKEQVEVVRLESKISHHIQQHIDANSSDKVININTKSFSLSHSSE